MQDTESIRMAADKRLGSVLGEFASDQDRIRANVELSDQEREDRLLDSHEKHAKRYDEVIAERNKAFEGREAVLRQRAWGVPDGLPAASAYTNALIAAHNSSDDGLVLMAQLAAQTGDSIMGRAATAAAMQRGNLGLVSSWINSSDETKAVFRELSQMPSPEERAKSAASRLPVPSLESVTPSPREVMEAERMKRTGWMSRRMRAQG